MAISSELCVECPDGSVEIFESQKKKSKQALMFVGATVITIGLLGCMRSSSESGISRMAVLIALPLAITLILLTVLVVLFNRKTSSKPIAKFTQEGFTVYTQSGKWSDISKAYATEHTCVLLSRKAGEIQLLVMYLELTPVELLKLVHRFAPNLSVE